RPAARFAGLLLGIALFTAGFAALPALPFFPSLAGGIVGQVLVALIASLARLIHFSWLLILLPAALRVCGAVLIGLSAGITWRALISTVRAPMTAIRGVAGLLGRVRLRRRDDVELEEDSDAEWEDEDEADFEDDEDEFVGDLDVPPERFGASDVSGK